MQNWQTIKEISGALLQAHMKPKPRFDLDVSQATSLIDISDGLASEANHIAKASNVKLEIIEDKLPQHERVLAFAKRANQQARDWLLYGGEDYELLATFPPGLTLPAGFTPIGSVTHGEGVTIVQPNGETARLEPRGFSHFA